MTKCVLFPSSSLPWPLWRLPSQVTTTKQELQLQLHQYPTKFTRGKPSQNPTPTNLQLQLQLRNRPTESTTRGKPSQNPTPTNLQLQLQPQLRHRPTKSNTRGRPSQNPTLNTSSVPYSRTSPPSLQVQVQGTGTKGTPRVGLWKTRPMLNVFFAIIYDY